MDLECPPIFAWATWRIYEADRDVEFLAEVYPHLQRHYDYWSQAHVIDEAFFTGGFLGMDNLPDRGLDGRLGTTQADASGWMAMFAQDMALIADELGDPDAAAAYRVDVERIASAINAELWDPDAGFYLDRRADRAFVRTESYSGLIPVIAGVVPADRLEIVIDRLRDESAFLSPAGIRSVSARSVLYEPGYAEQPGVNSNWRGPVWLPINYLLVDAVEEVDPDFARSLRERLVETVERDWRATGHFHEYFDAETGEGLGADQQTGWTALVANLIVEGWPPD
jgi:glycogen debranching enzyme